MPLCQGAVPGATGFRLNTLGWSNRRPPLSAGAQATPRGQRSPDEECWPGFLEQSSHGQAPLRSGCHFSTLRETLSGPFEHSPVEPRRGIATRPKRHAEVSCSGENWIRHEMVADRLWHRARFEMASHGVIDVLLEFAQVGRLGRNAAVTRGFVPRRDEMSRISTSFDDNHDLIHTSNSITVVPPITNGPPRSAKPLESPLA